MRGWKLLRQNCKTELQRRLILDFLRLTLFMSVLNFFEANRLSLLLLLGEGKYKDAVWYGKTKEGLARASSCTWERCKFIMREHPTPHVLLAPYIKIQILFPKISLQVARLQEQLQKEKSSRATLEAGLKFPPRPLSDLSSIDEKVSLSRS